MTPNKTIALLSIILALTVCSHAGAIPEPAGISTASHSDSGTLGTVDRPIIDSRSSLESERQKAIARGFPMDIVNRQSLVDVKYFSFDGRVHQGQLMIDHRLAGDIETLFRQILEDSFPIGSVIPISRFDWDDTRSMESNNTSGFNYRKIAGKDEWSNHAFGQAVDINTVQNPYITGRHISPRGARYEISAPGTFVRGSPLVERFKALGWQWGGDWKNIKDYQHFEKVLPNRDISP